MLLRLRERFALDRLGDRAFVAFWLRRLDELSGASGLQFGGHQRPPSVEPAWATATGCCWRAAATTWAVIARCEADQTATPSRSTSTCGDSCWTPVRSAIVRDNA